VSPSGDDKGAVGVSGVRVSVTVGFTSCAITAAVQKRVSSNNAILIDLRVFIFLSFDCKDTNYFPTLITFPKKVLPYALPLASPNVRCISEKKKNIFILHFAQFSLPLS
jgi:hypothetical protein